MEWLRASLGLAGFEAISNPRFRDDVAVRCAVRLEFLAELAHKYAKILNLLGTLPSPDSSEKRPMRNDFACVARQVDQEIEFLWREMYFLTSDFDFMSRQIDHEVTSIDGG
jgi:hypothetical protein